MGGEGGTHPERARAGVVVAEDDEAIKKEAQTGRDRPEDGRAARGAVNGEVRPGREAADRRVAAREREQLRTLRVSA